jgi:hypothetical protein
MLAQVWYLTSIEMEELTILEVQDFTIMEKCPWQAKSRSGTFVQTAGEVLQ